MDQEINIDNLTIDELQEEYRYLQQKCKQLREASEEDTQHIHELKRKLETANAVEQYLSQELESLTAAAGNANKASANNKLQDDHDKLQRKYAKLDNEFYTLQKEFESLSLEHIKLQNKFEKLNAQNQENEKSEMQADFDKLVERLQVLDQDNMELLQKLDQQIADTMKQSMILAEKEKFIELLQDKVMCLEENMRCKREEIEEKTHLLESAQEQLCEANGKISMLMSAPENKDRKGNSLFAEVDDQRQVMKKLLAAQKKSYQEMKKDYNESQYEIRRLKRENSAMHTELQACSIIFRNADRTYQEKQSSRIRYLLNENEDLEKKLKRTQENLKDLAKDRGVPWLDSMLKFCRQETEDLKKQLYSVRIENASIGEHLRNVQQEMARWRFESLKLRCLLIDRENLLTQHEINFKPQNCVEYDVTEEELNKARPRIVPMEQKKTQIIESSPKVEQPSIVEDSKITDVSSKLLNTLKEKAINFRDDPPTEVNAIINNSELEILPNLSNSHISIDTSLGCINNENIPTAILKPTNSSLEHSSASIKNETEQIAQQTINSRLQIKSVENLNIELNKENDLKSPSFRPSIMSKDRGLITETTDKKVRFAAVEASVHNLSASPNKGVLQSIDNETNEMKPNLNSATTVKTIRTKSNVIVRRIVVNPKPK